MISAYFGGLLQSLNHHLMEEEKQLLQIINGCQLLTEDWNRALQHPNLVFVHSQAFFMQSQMYAHISIMGRAHINSFLFTNF